MKKSTALMQSIAPILTRTGISKIASKLLGGVGNIFVLHRVIPPKLGIRIHNHETLEISPAHLENIILYLKKHTYHFYSLDQVYQKLSENNPLNPFVVFTFDDGYKDNLQYAYPIFKKHNIPFTIFVTTSFPDHSAVIWWYMLEDYIINNEYLRFEDKGKEYCFELKFMKQKEQTFNLVREIFISKPENELLDFTAKVFYLSTGIIDEYCKKISLSWEDLKLLADDPLVTIGAHTVNHVGLSNRTTEEVKFEMSESKKLLEKATGRFIQHFSYPFGTKSEAFQREYELATLTGYLTACTTRHGQLYPVHRENLTALPRMPINAHTTSDFFELLLSGLISYIKNHQKKIVT